MTAMDTATSRSPAGQTVVVLGGSAGFGLETGDDLDRRREELRTKLPIHRVVQPSDVAALAVRLMVNTALTGATSDLDGGRQIV